MQLYRQILLCFFLEMLMVEAEHRQQKPVSLTELYYHLWNVPFPIYIRLMHLLQQEKKWFSQLQQTGWLIFLLKYAAGVICSISFSFPWASIKYLLDFDTQGKNSGNSFSLFSSEGDVRSISILVVGAFW